MTRSDDNNADALQARYELALSQVRKLRTKGRAATLSVVGVGMLALLAAGYAKYTSGWAHELLFRSLAGP